MSDSAVLDRANRMDFQQWLELAAEVEHLFGPMCDVPEFRQGLLVERVTGPTYEGI